ncbi:hypothetical protein [Clostridium tunisiense]|uniref:hypothetical protein n=1 Tax=Clostridium tunisiense TaxID=219748 RepID=UPI00031F79B2|nr:hypothetical protein [Clostridium tunisiense]
MKKVNLAIITVLIMLVAIVTIYETMLNNKSQQGDLRGKIYSYMMDKQNRIEVYEAAIDLNGGKSANTCVYFLSEVLRRNDVQISKDTANTSQILKKLNQMGWKKDTDYKNLQPGDIGFTTDADGNKEGIPTHTYIFMGWVEKGNYDFAYIVDNQAKDYDNKIYHISNIKNVGEANGFTKEAFSFFMRP